MRHQPNRRRTETLDYMQAMLGQLRTMAEAERCDMLAYLIEMAYIEIGDILRGSRPLRAGEDQRNAAAGMAFETSGKIKLQ